MHQVMDNDPENPFKPDSDDCLSGSGKNNKIKQ